MLYFYPLVLHLRLSHTCRELNEKLGVVGLDLRLVGGSVADGLAALFASVDYDISAARIGLCAYRHEKSAAGVGSVTGIYVNVQGMKAEWAVISRGVAERQSALVFLAYSNK